MAFKIEITCDFCKGKGIIEIENGNVFIICENCGQEREVTEGK